MMDTVVLLLQKLDMIFAVVLLLQKLDIFSFYSQILMLSISGFLGKCGWGLGILTISDLGFLLIESK